MIPAWLTDTVTSDLDRALHYTLLWGLEAAELRTVGGPADRVPHVNEAKVERRLREDEILPAALVPGLFEGHAGRRAPWLNALATFDETLRLCERIRCPRVVVSAFRPSADAEGDAEGTSEDVTEVAAEALRRAGRAAARRGIALAVLNEYGMAHATGASLARLLARVDHALVRAAWNPAAALRSGEDPARGLAALDGRVELVRCADGRDAGGTWRSLPLGEGAIDWPGQLLALHRQGFRGPVSLEITNEPRPTHGLRAATRLIRTLREVQRQG